MATVSAVALTTAMHPSVLWELQACLPAVHRICDTATSQAMAQAKPSQSQPLWLGLRILEAKATQSQAKATGFLAKPSQNITKYVVGGYKLHDVFRICDDAEHVKGNIWSCAITNSIHKVCKWKVSGITSASVKAVDCKLG